MRVSLLVDQCTDHGNRQAVPLVLSIVGVAMMISTENIGVRYTGICFLIMASLAVRNRNPNRTR
jgi:hypothetical protein